MNEKDIKALKWESDKRIGLGNGLYLNLRKSSKTFIVRIQHGGKSQIITIGKHPTLSLKDARVKAMNMMMKEDVSLVKVSQLKNKYWEEIVLPQSKVPKQVIGYLNNIEHEFGRRKVIDIKRAMLSPLFQKFRDTVVNKDTYNQAKPCAGCKYLRIMCNPCILPHIHGDASENNLCMEAQHRMNKEEFTHTSRNKVDRQ